MALPNAAGDGRRSGDALGATATNVSANAVPTSAAIRVFSRENHMIVWANFLGSLKSVPDQFELTIPDRLEHVRKPSADADQFPAKSFLELNLKV